MSGSEGRARATWVGRLRTGVQSSSWARETRVSGVAGREEYKLAGEECGSLCSITPREEVREDERVPLRVRVRGTRLSAAGRRGVEESAGKVMAEEVTGERDRDLDRGRGTDMASERRSDEVDETEERRERWSDCDLREGET